jgi:hypothetical protein
MAFFNLTVEKRFLYEDDQVIQARIESLMTLFQTNNSEHVSQMILNALETYKKFIVCETSMQNKVTGQTLENLIKSLLIITCHRKDYDHLKSLVSWSFPSIFQVFHDFLSDQVVSASPKSSIHHQRNQCNTYKTSHQKLPTFHLRCIRTRSLADGIFTAHRAAKSGNVESFREHHRRSRFESGGSQQEARANLPLLE